MNHKIKISGPRAMKRNKVATKNGNSVLPKSTRETDAGKSVGNNQKWKSKRKSMNKKSECMYNRNSEFCSI